MDTLMAAYPSSDYSTRRATSPSSEVVTRKQILPVNDNTSYWQQVEDAFSSLSRASDNNDSTDDDQDDLLLAVDWWNLDEGQ